LVNKHDDSPFAIDLAACSPLRVQDETLIMSCPNKVIHKRMVLKAPSSSMGYNDEYEAKKRDRASIEEMVKERFRVRRISYTLENRITT
jgi:hypothetical protein